MKTLYNDEEIARIESPSHQKWKLKERVKRASFSDVYVILREWIIRTEWLKVLAECLMITFREDDAFMTKFFQGKRFHYSELIDIREALKEQQFGESDEEKKEAPSVHWTNNFIFQLRNMVLDLVDFPASFLHDEAMELNEFQEHLKSFFGSLQYADTLGTTVLESFTRKENGTDTPILKEDLMDYWLTWYFQAISSDLGRKVKYLMILKQKLTNLQEKKKNLKLKGKKLTEKQENELQALPARIKRHKALVEEIIGMLPMDALERFKKARDVELALRKEEIARILQNFTIPQMKALVKKAFDDELESFRDDKLVLKGVFKPASLRHDITEISTDDFLKYFTCKFQWKIREHLKQHLLTEEFSRKLKGH